MLTIPRAIVLSGVCIALALAYGLTGGGDQKSSSTVASPINIISTATAQDVPARFPGPFMIAGAGAQLVWRIDQSTGAVSYCVRDTASVSRRAIRDDDLAPYCSAWSNPAGANQDD